MSFLRSLAALVAAGLLALSACGDPAEPGPLDGDAILQDGVLRIGGGDGPDDIAIVRSAGGVDVERDGATARFTGPVGVIEVSAGAGDDVVRYDQSVVADLELTILSAAGDDEVVASFAPTGPGTEMTLAVDIRTGQGSDRTEFRWDGGAVPALNPYITVTGETQGEARALPEVGDEVLVAFESGDPDRPVVIGGLWNGGAPAGSTGSDTRRLSLVVDLRTGRADAAIGITGGAGPDRVDLDVDYSGVALQGGTVAIDADLGGDDNHHGQYIVTSVTHTSVDTRIAAGDGNDAVELEGVFGGDGERAYALDLGDGDNQTTVSFGDGIRGRRPSTGTRSVTGTYRSGSGASSVTLSSDVVEPLASDFTIDYGTGRGDTYGRYKVRLPWDRPAGQADIKPGLVVKVVVNSPMESALDLRVDVGDPDVDDPAAFGAVTAQAGQVRESDLQFIHRLAEPAGANQVEEEWEIRAAGFVTAGDGSLVVDVPPGLDRLVYLQDALEVAQGATMRVDFQGADSGDAVLAHLIGISGAGRYEFLADGGAGPGLLAVLTRGLDASGGATMAFDVSGGGDDDVLGLARPADIVPGAPIAHALAGGAGTDACFAPQTVSVTACERLEPIGDELLRLIETTFGAVLADVWRQ